MAVSSKIVIAGAGVFGSAIAAVLARAGHRVEWFDPTPPQASASGVAAGMIAPALETLFDEASRERFELLADARDLWPRFAEQNGIRLERSGALAVGGARQVAGWSQALGAVGCETRALDPEETARIAPALKPGVSGLLAAGDWRVEPVPALDALRALAARRGARLVPSRLAGFRRNVGAADATGAAHGDLLIVATGADAGLAFLAPEIEALTPVKGHILRAPQRLVTGPALRAPGVYLCGDAGGTILGATMEDGRADAAVDPALVARLIARGADLAPKAAEATWRAATGVRAATADGLPLVGRSATEGVILAVGARRNGWLLAPMVAQVVLDLVEGRPKSPAAELFDPRRLSV